MGCKNPGGMADAPKLPVRFENCYLEGHVDFIFGGATCYFERCRIHCLRGGYITAASTPDTNRFGYVFYDCEITGGWMESNEMNMCCS